MMKVEMSIRKNAENLTEFSNKQIETNLRIAETNTVFNTNQSFYVNADGVLYEGIVKRIVISGK